VEDKKRVIKSSAFLGFTFIGASVIGDAIDAFEGLDTIAGDFSNFDDTSMDVVSSQVSQTIDEQFIIDNPNMHHVELTG
jgi:hypothetical protein